MIFQKKSCVDCLLVYFKYHKTFRKTCCKKNIHKWMKHLIEIVTLYVNENLWKNKYFCWTVCGISINYIRFCKNYFYYLFCLTDEFQFVTLHFVFLLQISILESFRYRTLLFLWWSLDIIMKCLCCFDFYQLQQPFLPDKMSFLFQKYKRFLFV